MEQNLENNLLDSKIIKPFDCDINDIGFGTGREPHWILFSIYMKLDEHPEREEVIADNFCKLFSSFVKDLKKNNSAEMIDNKYTQTKWQAIKKNNHINLVYTDLSDKEIVFNVTMNEDSFDEFLEKLINPGVNRDEK